MSDQPHSPSNIHGHRLQSGGFVDRDKQVRFRFNDRYYYGYEGDTLASALLANGVHLVARSFKYHRPRGIMAAGTEEPNAMVQLHQGVRAEPNPKATQIPLCHGLVASSVNTWPSVKFDVQAINGLFHRFFAAGFYYKTLFGSPWAWHHVFEPMIRKSAGWGTAPTGTDPDCYDHIHKHVDVLVVGAGPAGLAAARDAASGGARVILADEQGRMGGSLLGVKRQINGQASVDWVEEQIKALSEQSETTLLPNTTVFGYYDQNYLVALEKRLDHKNQPSNRANVRQRVWHIRAKRVILATGAHERPLVFGDNDRPGIMLAGAVQTYINRYGVLPGKKAILFANNDGAYEAALDFKAAGGDLVAVIDTRKDPQGPLIQQMRETGTTVLPGHVVTKTLGQSHFTGVRVAAWDGEKITGKVEQFDAHLLMMSGGWSPVVHLFSQSSGKLKYDDEKAAFVPNLYAPNQDAVSIGGANGDFTLAECLRSGSREGVKAAVHAGFEDRKSARRFTVEEPEVGNSDPSWLIPSEKPVGQSKAKHFVDYQNDSTAADIQLAAREGFRSVEHMKRYTLTGFGTDQGKTGNINGLAILAQAIESSIPETGTTTFRPPYTPVTFGALAGREIGDLSDPIRTTPIHSAHVEAGAEFENVGQWKRPWFYAQGDEDMHAATRRECKAVRTSVGMMDASTLGKIDIQGPDAAEFINRFYTNAFLKLGVGKCRYGVMCGEDGMVFDDGVTSRISENHFHMTTTTGGAAHVMDWLEEYLQTEWPELQVYCTSVTEQWSCIAINGPMARKVMEALNPDVDWSNAAFPFMAWQEQTIGGVPARIFRISFTGELSFEINVPSRYGLALWKAVVEAGKPYDITPYGTETMHILRAEKGYIITGQDTDGSLTPQDLDMDWIVSKKKKDFIGKRSYSREDTSRTDRKQLVGLLTEDPNFVLEEGAQILEDPDAPTPIPMLGHVTSSYWSEALGHSIAMAVVKDGFNRKGEQLHTFSLGNWQKVTVVDPVFYDKEGARRDG